MSVSHPVFGEVLVGLSPFHLIFSQAWPRNFCPSAELRGEEVAVPWWAASLPEVAVPLYHGKGHRSSALVMPVARLGCVHGTPVQVLFSATWLHWKSPSHHISRVITTHFCAEGAENIHKLLSTVKSSFLGWIIVCRHPEHLVPYNFIANVVSNAEFQHPGFYI